MKKKMLAMFLALVLVGTQFVGCGNSAGSDEEKEKNTVEQEETKKEEKKEEIKPERGTVTDGVYVNEAFGVSIAIPEGWTLCSDEKLLEKTSMSESFLKEDGTYDAEDMLEENQGEFYDMHAGAPEDFVDVIVTYCDLEENLGQVISEKEYLEMLKEVMDGIEGYEIEEATTQDINGTEVSVLTVTMDGNYFEKTYCHKVGNYMAVIDIIYENDTQQIVEDVVSGIKFAK